MLIKLRYKLTATIVVFLCLCFSYYFVQRIYPGTLNLITDLDRNIPFVGVFVWPYISLFPVLALTFIFLVKRYYVFMTAMLSCIIATAIALYMYMLFPSSYMLRPDIITGDISSYMCALVYTHDLPNNSFPSLHVAYALIIYCILGISVYGHILWLKIAYLVWMLMVIASTLLIKQHHIIDVFCGMIVGYMSFLISKRLCNAKKP